jgi:hypothetical protein
MSVIIRVVLAGFRRVVDGMVLVTMCNMGVVPGFFVVFGGVMFRRGAMMFRGVLVVLGGFQVMVGDLFRHGVPFAIEHNKGS